MIYLDSGATSFPKPPEVKAAVQRALTSCANPGRGGYGASMLAQEQLFLCRQRAGTLFNCAPEQVVCTASCTQGLNMAIHTLVEPGNRVLLTGFEHNAVTRPLYAAGAEMVVAGQRLFDWEDTLRAWEKGLKSGVKAAVMTHTSNVFGYILPLEAMAELCRRYRVPFIVDAAQSAGTLPLDFTALGAAYIAMPGHKGLLGPQGTGLLLCSQLPKPLLCGGTGSQSMSFEMPDFLPDGAEAGTVNVPGIAGLAAGLAMVQRLGPEHILRREQRQLRRCREGLAKMDVKLFCGEHQVGTLSFVPRMDCEAAARFLARQGIAVRAGLHCAPLAHKSAGTLETGTVRISFGHGAQDGQTDRFLQVFQKIQQESCKKFL